MPDLTDEIRRPQPTVFRRAHIKRREMSNGLFESTWQDITDYVQSWGRIQTAVDDVRLNSFRHSGITLQVLNDTGFFNDENNVNSFWFGYPTRYRTLVRIQGGYVQDDSVELPTDPSLGIFILDSEIGISSKSNLASFQCSSLQSIFDEIVATDIVGVGATQTASQIIAKIRDHTDGSGNAIFREFITQTAWNIQATSNNYNFATSTSLDGLTAWQLMQKLAEAEGFVLYIDRFGGFNFTDRDVPTGTTDLSLYGQGFQRPNIISLDEYKEDLDKYYNFFRFKHLEADTSTSYVEAGTVIAVSATNLSWKYGQRIYNFENKFVSATATAQSIVDTLFSEFSDVKNELRLTCKFIPHIDILDGVSVSYHSYDIVGQTLWNHFEWDDADWADEGDNFDWDAKGFKVLSRTIDLNRMMTSYILREN